MRNIRSDIGNAENSPNLEEFTLHPEQKNFSVIDGMLCSSDGKQLIACPPAKAKDGTLTIPEGVTSLGYNALRNCSAKEIFLSNSLRAVNGYALPETLEILHIGESLWAIDKQQLPALKEITLSENNTDFLLIDNVLYESSTFSWDDNVLAEGATLVLYPSADPRTEFSVPETITTIKDGNFYHAQNLTSLTIPEGVKYLSNIASDCPNLKTLYLPSTLENMWIS